MHIANCMFLSAVLSAFSSYLPKVVIIAGDAFLEHIITIALQECYISISISISIVFMI
jgi:hypothetical protein